MSTLSIDQIEKVYNGRSGCMCGCRGTYRDAADMSKSALTRAFNKVINDPEVECDEDDGIYYINNGKRTTVIYFK